MSLESRITALAQATGADIKSILLSIATLNGPRIIYPVTSLSGTSVGIDCTTTHKGFVSWALTASSTVQSITMTSGDFVVLAIDATSYPVTWPGSVAWATDDGAAPALSSSCRTFVALFQIDSTIYGFQLNV